MTDDEVCLCGHRRFIHSVTGGCHATLNIDGLFSQCPCNTFRLYVQAAAPSVRPSDPWTSHEAAAKQERKVGPLAAAVLLYFQANPDTSDDDLHAKLGGPESSARKRRTELQRSGLIEDSGSTVNEWGSDVLTWKLTARGLTYVHENFGRLIELRDTRRPRSKRKKDG